MGYRWRKPASENTMTLHIFFCDHFRIMLYRTSGFFGSFPQIFHRKFAEKKSSIRLRPCGASVGQTVYMITKCSELWGTNPK